MTKIKNALSSIAFAATLLFACGVAQFGIITLVKQYTGWKMPNWVATAIAGLAAAGAIISMVSSFGYTLPAGVAATLKALTAVSS